MANPVDSSKILKDISRHYELDPKNWRLIWGTDEKGHHNLLAAKDNRLWWVKEELINPFTSVGCGVRSPIEVDLEQGAFGGRSSAPSYGLRPIPEEQLKKILGDLAMGITPQATIQRILLSEPRPLRELDTSFLMQGPYHHVPRLTEILSDRQKKLDAKLNSELERLLLKRCPQLLMSYT